VAPPVCKIRGICLKAIAATKRNGKLMEIPNTPVLAKLPYKSAIKKAQAEVDELYSAWVEEDSIWEELKAQLDGAQVADAVAFKKAAIAGDPMPDETSTREIEKMMAYQEVRTQHAKSQCEKAGRKLSALVRERKDEVIALAIEKARKGVLLWQKEVDEIAERQMKAMQTRSDSLDGVRMLAHWDLTAEVIKFDPHFPLVGNFMVPSSHETRLLGLLDGLERTFLMTPEKVDDQEI